MTPYYDDGAGIVIYHGEAAHVLPFLPPVDLVLTDPPYGLERFKKGFGATRFCGLGAEKLGATWDTKPDEQLLALVLGAGAHAIVWGANNFQLPQSERFLVWDKYQTVDNFADAELAYTNLPITAKVFRYSIHKHNSTTTHEHVAQKPEALMRWCLTLAPDARTVLDPFMGSGTTLVACKRLGRACVGIEREERYCAMAVERLSQGSLFSGVGRSVWEEETVQERLASWG